MVGVLTVPLKGSENMFRSGYSLTDSHPVIYHFVYAAFYQQKGDTIET